MKTADDILAAKRSSRMLAVSEDTTIFETVQKMVTEKVGSMMIKKENDVIGIWTERDLLRNMLEPGFDPKTAKVGDHMTRKIVSVPHDAPIVKLEEMLLGLYLRHLVVSKEGKYIGVISIGDVVRASLLEKDRKIRELHKIASWEYYENWGWSHKYETRE